MNRTWVQLVLAVSRSGKQLLEVSSKKEDAGLNLSGQGLVILKWR